MISLIVISGRSGSEKSTALHVFEDMGFYCIDNLPVTLLRHREPGTVTASSIDESV